MVTSPVRELEVPASRLAAANKTVLVLMILKRSIIIIEYIEIKPNDNSSMAQKIESEVRKPIATGIGFGRVVCPAVRKKNNTHHNNKPSLIE